MTEHLHYFRGEPPVCDCGLDHYQHCDATVARLELALAWHEERHGTRAEQEEEAAEEAAEIAEAAAMTAAQIDEELRLAGMDPEEVGRKGAAFMRVLFRSMRLRAERDALAQTSVALSPEGEEVRGRVEAALAESRERMPDPLVGASGCALPRGLRAWTAAEARRWPGESGRRVARKAGAP